jgi:MYXO-CTERM domain-containing protein
MAGDTATYDLTFLNLLTGNPFVENDSRWSSVAHVQGIIGNCSGWIVSGDGTGAEGSGPCHNVTAPEPGKLGMFGLGLLFVGLFLGLRRRYN